MNLKEFIKTKLKGAIFDFDGTLFDSMYVWDNIANNFLLSIGINPPKDYRDALKPLSLLQSAVYTKRRFELEQPIEEIVSSVNQMIEHCYFHDILPKNKVEFFLQSLKEQGMELCIATATEKYLVEAALNRCNLSHYFSEIFTCSSVGYGKDNPKIYETALSSLHTEKTNTLIFEDALHALKTAKAAGFITAAVFDSSELNQSEVKEVSDYYIEDYSISI